MITSALVNQMRKEMSDVPLLKQDRITGDGVSTVYQTKYNPILEDSMVLRVGGVTQAEGAGNDYVLNDDTGVIDLNNATSAGIEARYKSVNFTNAEWIDAIGDTIDEMGDKFFKTVIRSTSAITLSAGVTVYDCPSSCIDIIEFKESLDNTSAGTAWSEPYVNWRYDRRSNQLILGDPPTRANYTQISFIRSVAKPASMSAELDLENSWIQMVKRGAEAKYLRSVAAKIAQQGNANTEMGMLQVNQMRAMASDYEAKFEILRRREKPVRPARDNKYRVVEGGTV